MPVSVLSGHRETQFLEVGSPYSLFEQKETQDLVVLSPKVIVGVSGVVGQSKAATHVIS